ncbi:hypothetical protein [Synoicihabitans lomoniglobus]|uniref:Ribbon-helix-helix protein CopG domain-containing protein n=1 Tax=Synoicihabitans lomoniglobus TaxID=2909285 RepID=A0AAE9ZY48_9BACT|nr:ribbon-helix-helix domain-containing protein [Opitutaceae bacterium LMO-M01]WED65324.1 hypothetical protein PXH66_00490 [Opitutaceae bacterium LMO-M01]
MKTFTAKIPATLAKKLKATAKRKGSSVSDLARAALEREVDEDATDFATAAARYRGMIKDGPTNLSTREGYGREDHRGCGSSGGPIQRDRPMA